jgi:signal transduction histidine kinase
VKDTQDVTRLYAVRLEEFLHEKNERSLYNATQMARELVEGGVGPEEVVALHTDALERSLRDLPPLERTRLMSLSFQFLVEMMITYGVFYKQYLDLRAQDRTQALERNAEIQRVRSEEMIRLQAQTIKDREAFLTFVAHELRNPLTILVGNIEYLLTGKRSGEPERQTRILNNLKTAATRLQNLVTNLLAMSRMQREGGQVLSSLSLKDIIQQAVDEVVLQATDRRIELEVEPSVDLPPINGDETALVRLFSNLLENGIKYTPMGGRVWVRTSSQNGVVAVEIGDNGQGVPSEELPHLFDLYYRARSSGTPFAKGSGLGLALAKTIVDRHGGEILVESKVGEGTVFTIKLNAAYG